MKEEVTERIIKMILSQTLSTLLSEPSIRQHEVFKGEKKGTWESSLCFCLSALLLEVLLLWFETVLLCVKLTFNLSM